MKLTRSHALIAAMAVVIAVLIWALIYFARDEWGAVPEEREQQIETPSTAGVEKGRPFVRVTAESQNASGIEVQPLKPGKSEAAAEAYGMVMSLQPLAEMRGRYLTAVAEARALHAAVTASESEFRRMESLFRDDRNVSEQALKSAEGRYRSEQARQLAAEQSAAAVRDSMRSAWGETVTGWAINPDSRVMQAMLRQSAYLVQLVLPYDLPRNAVRRTILVAPAAARENTRAARFVSDSPQVDAALPGETYFYMVEGGGLRAGMRVLARIGLGGAPVAGMIVPPTAVIWHSGKAWAYVKDDEQTFSRHEVSTGEELNGGWFNSTGFDDDDEVVVSGAQLLLSEELKYQIRNENED
jgi:multidrug efflux pump subunit AcrA (membrane-fusion protein)